MTQKVNIFNVQLEYLEMGSSTVQEPAHREKQAETEQARRVTDRRRDWRWKMAELKDRQHQEMEGKLQFH